jgi:hypothetical protein
MIWHHRSWGSSLMGPGPGYLSSAEPLNRGQAKELLDRYIASSGNPNIKIGDIIETRDYFKVEILTKNDSLVDVLWVDKQTGWIKPTY